MLAPRHGELLAALDRAFERADSQRAGSNRAEGDAFALDELLSIRPFTPM